MAESDVLLLSSEPETVASVSSALNSCGRFRLAGVSDHLPDLANRLAGSPVPAALVDVDPEPAHMFRELDRLIPQFAETRFVILSREFRSDLVCEAMQVGARHFLVKQSIAYDLGGVLQRLVPAARPHGGHPDGAIVTVLSASGGCGATTVACNLANELALAQGRPALLVDLDNSYGGVAPHLGIEGRYGVADVLARDGEMDAHLVRSTAVPHSNSLHVLLSPAAANFAHPETMRLSSLSDLAKNCRLAYPYTVIDAPRVPMTIADVLAEASDAVVIAFQLNVKDVRTCRMMHAHMVECGIPRERLILLVNRYRRGSSVSLEEARKAIGAEHVELVRNDFKHAVDSINFGQLLAGLAPSSGLRRDIQQLAANIPIRTSIHSESLT